MGDRHLVPRGELRLLEADVLAEFPSGRRRRMGGGGMGSLGVVGGLWLPGKKKKTKNKATAKKRSLVQQA